MTLQAASDHQRPTSPPDFGAAATSSQFITFTLGAEEFGVDIMLVQEIKGWSATTAIPNAPPFIRGVINLRGIIVPILDLRARLGMAPIEPTGTNVVIIIATGTRTTGLLVDAVSDIITVSADAIRPVPDLGGAGGRLLSGLVPRGERMVSLVAFESLLASPEPEAAAPN